MKIRIEKQHFGKQLWHRDCPKSSFKSGIIQELKQDKENDLFPVKCLECGKEGLIPRGTQFNVDVTIPDSDSV